MEIKKTPEIPSKRKEEFTNYMPFSISYFSPTVYTLGWSDFSFLWNFEKKQVGVVTFGKKTCFHFKKI